jgi:transposase
MVKKEELMAARTRSDECSVDRVTLFVAFDLGARRWKSASANGLGVSIRQKEVVANDPRGLAEELRRAKDKFGLAEDAPVKSCYEAGRDGFAPHRLLTSLGVENLVVDPSSIEVPRRMRRAKTDRLDAAKLLPMLILYHLGERERLRIVRVPSVETEDRRHLHRQIGTAQKDRQRVRNRITSLLATQGARLRLDKDFVTKLADARRADAGALPPELQTRLRDEWALLEVLDRRVTSLECERHRRVLAASDEDEMMGRVKHLMRLRGVGETSAWVLTFEYFWRSFNNRRQVAAGAGLTPTPFSSGELVREQGIGKAGNARIRSLMVELAWGWLRWQPNSDLTVWFNEHFGSSKRQRRVGVVAVARRLLIALWRYVETGEIPEGALLKSL